jgi:hypothetical protein
MVIFHSYVNVYQRVYGDLTNKNGDLMNNHGRLSNNNGIEQQTLREFN